MTLDLAAARALGERPALLRLRTALSGEGDETRIVGGAIRNALIGRPVHDIDLATTARPPVVMGRAAAAGLKAVPTGIDHGTVTVVVDGTPFEVTTLREDVATDGRHAVVRFGRDFAADALRRDFTVNALSLGEDGTLHDDTGGMADLAARRIRFIGDPLARIREDYLRTLRFFRFHAEYGSGPIDADGLRATIRARDGLRHLSRERVRAEFLKLLVADRGPETALAFQEAGLLGHVVAGVGDAGRLARAARAGQDAVGRLAAFLVRTAEDADRLRAEFRLSNEEHARLRAYAAPLEALSSRSEAAGATEVRRLAVLFGVPALRDAVAALSGEPRLMFAPEGCRLLERYARGADAPPRFPLSGGDLVGRGVAPGPEIGRRLAEARSAWLAAGCPDGWTW